VTAKKALIIGPAYAPPNDIQSTAQDIINWTNTLQTRGYNLITKVIGLAATRSAIITATKAFLSGLQSGDRAAIVRLGHGYRIPGNEPDGWDECFVASDLGLITDDEMAGMLMTANPNAIIDVVNDFCYAGTSSIGAPIIDSPNIRSQAYIGKIEYRSEARVYPKVPTILKQRHWDAGKEDEITYGVLSGGKWNSIYSLYLCWALRNYPTKTASEIHNIVAGYVTLNIPAQHPQLNDYQIGQVPF
jgi:hypothetical protein